MYKDRGTMKWTAMMLPEHVAQLRDWRQANDIAAPQPLEPWQLDELNDEISAAYESKKPITLHVYESGWTEIHGYITALNATQKEVLIDDELITKAIPVRKIHHVTTDD
ncbi:YolD-like family protein [Kurthia zopfii]|uniref:YolD-like family protein n=1 Tax=Kurthia zopfii TaxID=1650 RepID=UPI000F6CC478|nr:YolD-like family protein [Kurthia zopfii]VEI05589.1 YolD-like protein [Kurthia zopfii]